jgi:FimV-like protein
MERGDVDAARSMLEAALIEGNESQQEEAFRLLDQLDG